MVFATGHHLWSWWALEASYPGSTPGSPPGVGRRNLLTGTLFLATPPTLLRLASLGWMGLRSPSVPLRSPRPPGCQARQEAERDASWPCSQERVRAREKHVFWIKKENLVKDERVWVSVDLVFYCVNLCYAFVAMVSQKLNQRSHSGSCKRKLYRDLPGMTHFDGLDDFLGNLETGGQRWLIMNPSWLGVNTACLFCLYPCSESHCSVGALWECSTSDVNGWGTDWLCTC